MVTTINLSMTFVLIVRYHNTLTPLIRYLHHPQYNIEEVCQLLYTRYYQTVSTTPWPKSHPDLLSCPYPSCTKLLSLSLPWLKPFSTSIMWMSPWSKIMSLHLANYHLKWFSYIYTRKHYIIRNSIYSTRNRN